MTLRAQNVRDQYPAGSYVVAGTTVSIERLKVRTMNFGQHWRGEAVISLPYTFKLPLQLAIDIVNWLLPEYVEDSKEYPDPEDLMEQLLKQEGWNTDGQYLLTEGPELLRQMLIEYYAHDMLMQWIGDGSLEQDGYVINSCDLVEIHGDQLVIEGKCRASGTSAVYQDH